MFPHGETVTFLHAPLVVDGYGNTSPDWSTPTETVVARVGVEPRPSAEPFQDARNATTTGYTLYLDTDHGVTSADRVQVRGIVYDVDGDVAVWRHPFSGWAPGVVVQTKRVAG